MQPSHTILRSQLKTLKNKSETVSARFQNSLQDIIVVGILLIVVYIFLFILAISIPLKAFNDQRSKKMIACGEKNTLGSEHSSNIPLAVIWNVKLYTFLMKINVCVCHVRYQGVLVLARTFLIAFLSWWWWWHNLCFQILICRFKLAGIWKYYLLHNMCRTS